MTIRTAAKEDVCHIAKLYVHNHKTTYKYLLPPEYFETLTEEYALSKWSDYVSSAENFVLVAEDEGDFLGFAASMPDEELPNVWYLDSLHICEKSRGKGIGSALITATGKYALRQGYDKMSICIVKGNDKAGTLYRKLGAEHYKDFTGRLSHSEKLLWHDLTIFK